MGLAWQQGPLATGRSVTFSHHNHYPNACCSLNHLRAGLASISRGSERAAGLAVAADLIASDERVHVEVRETLRSGVTEVALWGDGWPVKLGGQVEAVQYRLSAAARIFKGHALAAGGLTDVSVSRTETLFRSGYCPLDSDLIPV